MSDTEEGPSDETAVSGSKSTRPAAMTAEEQAEQTRYSELFGGKPKAKAKGGGGASEVGVCRGAGGSARDCCFAAVGGGVVLFMAEMGPTKVASAGAVSAAPSFRTPVL